jgi:DNA-binding SARP family transcriptional activator
VGTTLCELGVLSLRDDAESRVVAGRRAASVLSLLSVDRRRVRTLDEFVEAGWRGDDRPRSARQSITNVISQLRREHGSELIETVGPGYRLGAMVESEREQFLALLTAANEALSAERALEVTAEAAVLWRGEPWSLLDDVDELRVDQSRLSQAWQRIRALRAESLHHVGRLVEAQAMWAELADENPLDEDAWIGWARSLEVADRRPTPVRTSDRPR